MPLVFKPFNPKLPVEVYRRNLPHWRQAGVTYFVTFRLYDSIPQSVLAKWKEERSVWLKANGITPSLSRAEQMGAYLRIEPALRKKFERSHARRLFAELDECHGNCIFRVPECRAVLEESMLHFNGERFWSGDFVIMPNHVHWIVQPLPEDSLENILQSIKRYVSTRLTRLGLHQKGRLWQSESHDHIIRDRTELTRIREYIRTNPEKARLPEKQYTLHTVGWLDD